MTESGPIQPSGDNIEFARQVARIAADNRTEELVILDLRGLSPVADYFVIGTGTSDRQIRSTIEAIEDHARTANQTRFGLSGFENATWILADYVDVVVHLFDAERRRYYDLDMLWGDAPRVDWEASSPARSPGRGFP